MTRGPCGSQLVGKSWKSTEPLRWTSWRPQIFSSFGASRLRKMSEVLILLQCKLTGLPVAGWKIAVPLGRLTMSSITELPASLHPSSLGRMATSVAVVLWPPAANPADQWSREAACTGGGSAHQEKHPCKMAHVLLSDCQRLWGGLTLRGPQVNRKGCSLLGSWLWGCGGWNLSMSSCFAFCLVSKNFFLSNCCSLGN